MGPYDLNPKVVNSLTVRVPVFKPFDWAVVWFVRDYCDQWNQGEKLTYLMLYSRLRDDVYAWPGKNRLARNIGASHKRTPRAALKALVNRGALTLVEHDRHDPENGAQRGDLYQIHPPWEADNSWNGFKWPYPIEGETIEFRGKNVTLNPPGDESTPYHSKPPKSESEIRPPGTDRPRPGDDVTPSSGYRSTPSSGYRSTPKAPNLRLTKKEKQGADNDAADFFIFSSQGKSDQEERRPEEGAVKGGTATTSPADGAIDEVAMRAREKAARLAAERQQAKAARLAQEAAEVAADEAASHLGSQRSTMVNRRFAAAYLESKFQDEKARFLDACERSVEVFDSEEYLALGDGSGPDEYKLQYLKSVEQARAEWEKKGAPAS